MGVPYQSALQRIFRSKPPMAASPMEWALMGQLVYPSHAQALNLKGNGGSTSPWGSGPVVNVAAYWLVPPTEVLTFARWQWNVPLALPSVIYGFKLSQKLRVGIEPPR